MKNDVYLHASKVLAGKELLPVENAYVHVSGGMIAEVLTSLQFSSRKRTAEVLELGTVTLLPGLIDCHAHLALDARIPGHLDMMEDPECRQTLRALKSATDDLKAGITGLRCLGDRYYLDVELRDMEQAGKLELPWMQVAGIGMKGLHGHGYVGKGFSGCEEFRRQARENLFHHTDWLKVFITAGAPPVGDGLVPWYISREEVRTVVNEAKANGARTSAHCIGGTGLRYCCEEGIDVLDHCYWADEEDTELILKHGTTVCFTPGVFMDESREPMCPTGHVEKVRKTRDEVRRRLAALVAAGPKFVVGSDAYHGLLWKELTYMKELGMVGVEALKGVTVYAGELMGRNVGVVAESYQADLIAVDGDPVLNPSVLASPRFIMHDGVVVGK